jgi:hypothetical protein
LLIINIMGGESFHAKIAAENLQGAAEELAKKRFSNVAFLSMRALEQMIEACASKEGLHFHENPRTAHKNRRDWLKARHPDLAGYWDQLWGIYGALGNGGMNGDRASQAEATARKCLSELSRRENIAVTRL